VRFWVAPKLRRRYNDEVDRAYSLSHVVLLRWYLTDYTKVEVVIELNTK
jgi:hypothetical protein